MKLTILIALISILNLNLIFYKAAVDIVLTWGSIVQCINLFTPIDKTAGKLLWPYLAWVSFASVLNFSMWYLNRGQSSIKKD